MMRCDKLRDEPPNGCTEPRDGVSVAWRVSVALMRNVMRRERRWVLVVAYVIALIVASYGMIWRYGQRPALVSVGVVGQHVKDDTLIVSVIATNTGQTLLVCHGHPPFRDVRVRTDRGWTNMPKTYLSQQSSIGFLLPGRLQQYSITVPRSITGLQVTCCFESAGAKTFVASRLMEIGWWNRLYPILRFTLPVLPDGTGNLMEFSTPVVEIQAIE